MKIREVNIEKDLMCILNMYIKCFAGYPWFETLSMEEVTKRWLSNSSQQNFTCIVAELNDEVAGSMWWNDLTETALLKERGPKLFAFAKENFPNIRVVWERELMVSPEFTGKKIASNLRGEFLSRLLKRQAPFLILTRMRDDNFAVIKIAERIGYARTGIRMPCSIKPSVCHEYWYRAIDT